MLPANAPTDTDKRLYTASFAIAFAVQFCLVVSNSLMVHYARWIEFLGGNVRDVGWVMGGGAAVAFLLRPWTGGWINRYGPRRVWCAGLVVYASSACLNLLVVDIGWLVYVARVGWLVGLGLAAAGSLTWIVQSAPAGRQTEAIAVFGASGFIGMIVGPFGGDLILGGGQRTRGDFVVLFAMVGATLGLAALVLAAVRAPQVKSPRAPLGLRDYLRTVRQHWPGPVSIVSVMFTMCVIVPAAFLTSFVDQAGLDAAGVPIVGLFFLTYGGAGLMVRLALSRSLDGAGRRTMLVAGLLLMSAGMFSFLLAEPQRPWLVLLPAALCGTGHGISFPAINTLILDPFPNHRRGTGSTLALMLSDVGVLAGAPLLGLVAGVVGYRGLFITAGATSLFTTGLFICSILAPAWQARRRARRPAAPSDTFFAPNDVLSPLPIDDNPAVANVPACLTADAAPAADHCYKSVTAKQDFQPTGKDYDVPRIHL